MMALPSPCQFRFFAVGRHTLAATQSVDLRLKFNQIWFEQGLSNQNWSFINDMPYPSLVNRFRKLYTFKLHFLLFFLIWGGRNSISLLKIRVRRLYKSICKKKKLNVKKIDILNFMIANQNLNGYQSRRFVFSQV